MPPSARETEPKAPPSADSVAVREYLGRVRSHLPVGAAPDILRELRSAILDRADEIADAENRPINDEILVRALDRLGNPEVVAQSYAPQRDVIPAESRRAFIATFALLFTIHLVLLAVATAMGRAMELGPLALAPVAPGLVTCAFAALHAMVLDLGLATLTFCCM